MSDGVTTTPRGAGGRDSRRGRRAVLLVLLVLVVLVASALGYVAWVMGGEPGSGEPVDVTVAGGATATVVGVQLHDEGVIRSALAFRLRARSRGLDRNLRAGEYHLETGMSIDEAIDVLEQGPDLPDDERFTVPEGLTVAQTLERLEQQTPFAATEYRAVLDARILDMPEWVPPLDSFGEGVREPYEGLLYPQTYTIPVDATPQIILQRMIDELDSVVSAVPSDAVAATAGRGLDRYQALVIASLVEEEARIAEERPTIASVIVNRLEIGQPLQIDAANIYVVGEHTDRVTDDYLEVDSPYNLYTNAGLPPTPIAAAGAASIAAAFAPEDTEYLYYVKIDVEGHHAFAETYEEHLQNVERYRDLQETESEAVALPAPRS